MGLDVKKHIKAEKRLNQAVNNRLPEIKHEIAGIMKKYNIDAMPDLAFDVCKHTIEELYLERFNHPEC